MGRGETRSLVVSVEGCCRIWQAQHAFSPTPEALSSGVSVSMKEVVVGDIGFQRHLWCLRGLVRLWRIQILMTVAILSHDLWDREVNDSSYLTFYLTLAENLMPECLVMFPVQFFFLIKLLDVPSRILLFLLKNVIITEFWLSRVLLYTKRSTI